MRTKTLTRACALLLVLCSLAAPAAAQSIDVRSSSAGSIGGSRSGTVSTTGSDCVTATACVGFRVDGMASWSIYLDVGTSGTFNFEVTNDDPSEYTSTTARWSTVTEDVGGATSATADGLYYFTNPGVRWFRARASAISGNASVTAARGLVGLKSTASVAGGGDMSQAAFNAAFGTAGTPDSQVMTVQGAASMTPLSVNLFVGGTAVATGGGATGATVPRVDIANDGDIAIDIDATASNTGAMAGSLGTIASRLVVAGVFDTTSKTEGDQSMCNGSTATPTGAAGDQRSVQFWCTRTGALNVVSSSTGATGSAVPAGATYAGVNVGGNTRGLTAVNPSGSIYAAQIDIASVLGATISATNPVFVKSVPGTAGGWDAFNATAADGATACTNTAQAVKASPGLFGGYVPVNNPNTADSWLQIYDVAAGSVTVGTTNPKLTIRIPGIAANSVAGNVVIPEGVTFGTAIAIACTSTAGGNGAPSVAVETNILFK
jgi:hypothetical protein